MKTKETTHEDDARRAEEKPGSEQKRISGGKGKRAAEVRAARNGDVAIHIICSVTV